MDNTTILNGLNEDQKKPVLDYYGASFILAGPGSGKTKTVISRTAYMINQGIHPENIILFTFTNKAAKEIKERVVKFIGKDGERITVGTYHSVCVRFLKRYANRIGYTNKFSIFDTDDCCSILKKLCKGLNFDYKRAFEYISNCKSKNISPESAIQRARGIDEKYAMIYRQYQDELKKQDAMDFDDLIINTIKLFESCPDVLEKINKQYTYITSDEFHDSNSRDIKLIQLLAGENQNVCMILDPDQSIYGFRGADIEKVLNVHEIFPDLKTFVLHRNYRSSQTIVNAACSLIEKNTKTIKKELYSKNDVGDTLLYFEEEDQEKEALRCVKLIKALVNNKQFNLTYNDISILYRMSFMSRFIEEAFLKNGIPYKIVGGLPFCSRKEIKDILSYIKFAYNPFDFESFKRCIAIPKRGIGETTLEKIQNYSRTTYSEPVDLITACKEIDIKGKTKVSLNLFVSFIEKLNNLIQEDISPKILLELIIKEINYYQFIKDAENTVTAAEERIENVKELINICSTFDSIQEFLDNMSLNTTEVNEQEKNQVCLLTEHASKGLEYPAVIIIGCNEGTSPHYKAISQDEVEEERRLFYVGMTRAERYLFFTRSKKVVREGRFCGANESRFIKEINPKYIKKY